MVIRDIIWTPYGTPMDYLWTPYVPPMDPLWTLYMDLTVLEAGQVSLKGN